MRLSLRVELLWLDEIYTFAERSATIGPGAGYLQVP
jgi:hypothetical protein